MGFCWATGAIPVYPNTLHRPHSAGTEEVAHCKTRVRIEMTFGLLKSHFQCLKGLRVAPDRACDICVACAVLHNIAIIRRERMPAIAPEDNWEQIDPAAFENADGRAVRDLYSNT